MSGQVDTLASSGSETALGCNSIASVFVCRERAASRMEHLPQSLEQVPSNLTYPKLLCGPTEPLFVLEVPLEHSNEESFLCMIPDSRSIVANLRDWVRRHRRISEERAKLNNFSGTFSRLLNATNSSQAGTIKRRKNSFRRSSAVAQN